MHERQRPASFKSCTYLFGWQARNELHDLLAKPSLADIPLLVLGNKNDMPSHLSTNELIDRLELKVARNAFCFASLVSLCLGSSGVPLGMQHTSNVCRVRCDLI